MEGQKNIGRSAWALFAGFLTGALLSLGADELLHALGFFPPWGQPMPDVLFIWPGAYRLVFNTLGCYVAASLAPRKPMGHALCIGCLGFFISFAGTMVTWNHLPSLGPHWYSVLIVVTALPCAWLGGKLYLWEKTA